MNTEEIIKLAREAGGNDEFTSPPTDWNKGDFVISPEQLSKFAALIRNAALKEAIKVIEEYRIPVRAERLEKALKDIRSLSSINHDPFALTVLLSDIHHIADTALAERNDNG